MKNKLSWNQYKSRWEGSIKNRLTSSQAPQHHVSQVGHGTQSSGKNRLDKCNLGECIYLLTLYFRVYVSVSASFHLLLHFLFSNYTLLLHHIIISSFPFFFFSLVLFNVFIFLISLLLIFFSSHILLFSFYSPPFVCKQVNTSFLYLSLHLTYTSNISEYPNQLSKANLHNFGF